jgi:hypothetical protein
VPGILALADIDDVVAARLGAGRHLLGRRRRHRGGRRDPLPGWRAAACALRRRAPAHAGALRADRRLGGRAGGGEVIGATWPTWPTWRPQACRRRPGRAHRWW